MMKLEIRESEFKKFKNRIKKSENGEDDDDEDGMRMIRNQEQLMAIQWQVLLCLEMINFVN